MVKDNGKFKGCFVQMWQDSDGYCYYLEVGGRLFLLSCFGTFGQAWYERCPWESISQCVHEMSANTAEGLSKFCKMTFIKRFQV